MLPFQAAQSREAQHHDSGEMLLLINSSSLATPSEGKGSKNRSHPNRPVRPFCNSIDASCSAAILSHKIDTWNKLNVAVPARPKLSLWEKKIQSSSEKLPRCLCKNSLSETCFYPSICIRNGSSFMTCIFRNCVFALTGICLKISSTVADCSSSVQSGGCLHTFVLHIRPRSVTYSQEKSLFAVILLFAGSVWVWKLRLKSQSELCRSARTYYEPKMKKMFFESSFSHRSSV